MRISSMSALRELQQAFAASMLYEGDRAVHDAIVDDAFTAAERMRIYRNTFVATVAAALRLTYPAVDRIVGRDFFDAAAEVFIHAGPPASAYLNDYGGNFADFLAQFEPAHALPYLSDVARFEWALGVGANAIDMPALDARALAAMDAEDHVRLRFQPHPSVSLLLLDHPADQIADAVMSCDDAALADLDIFLGPVRLIVHRGAGGVESKRLESDAFIFLSRLCAGEPLGHLLDDSPENAPVLIAEQLTAGRLMAFGFEEKKVS
jgi:hypothetical protein